MVNFTETTKTNRVECTTIALYKIKSIITQRPPCRLNSFIDI